MRVRRFFEEVEDRVFGVSVCLDELSIDSTAEKEEDIIKIILVLLDRDLKCFVRCA